ncbi:GDSL-type esterase/lipase family protein [Bacillus cereus group sp. MYBK79-1]|uniref:GDSL-type esterase/lipase family protein n=1 Tax=unclassified Bacillus cereus group TaxID=2750818 RepID=UPI003F7A5BEE
MLKKVCVCLLTGAITITSAACVNNESEKKSNEVTQNTTQEKKSKNSAYQSTFKNSLFFGDSMIEAISHYEFLDDKNVLGSAGGATMFALDEVENVVKRKPEHIFMNFGSNDLLLPMDLEGKPIENPVKFSIDKYSKLIQKIKEQLPNVKIHLLSITPVTDKNVEEKPQYKHINEYNSALEKLAKAEKVEYIDLSSIFEKNKDLHDSDGVHFKADYYKILLEQLKGSVK